MTTTTAMPELPEPAHRGPTGTGAYFDSYTADQMRAYALATLQAQPAEVSDADILVVAEFVGLIGPRSRVGESHDAAVRFARAILALRPQAESAAPTVEAAREMGAKGGPVVEAERLAFEAWMAGHCWAVSPTWNGKTYDDSEEDKKRKLLDPLARTTRMLWAAWRDRAALSSLRPQAVPMTEWVSVKDRLPPRFQEVLVAFHGVDLPSTGQYTGNQRDHQGWCYPSENLGTAPDEGDPVVTHWMPLPPAPHHGITAPAGGEGKA